jgi:mono/diheme cytochrome c family protein
MKAMLAILGAILAALMIGAALFVYSGIYNVFADDPHWDATARILQTLRERSIARRAETIVVPNLEDPKLVAQGAGQYAAMCVGCHLAPGLAPNELSRGLYPAPPRLSDRKLDPRIAFIVVKHGIKMSGMPSWGSHGDEQIWSVVAFVGKLPGMSPDQYKAHVNSPEASTAAAMAAHGMAMPRSGASTPSMPMEGAHGPPGHHEMPTGR